MAAGLVTAVGGIAIGLWVSWAPASGSVPTADALGRLRLGGAAPAPPAHAAKVHRTSTTARPALTKQARAANRVPRPHPAEHAASARPYLIYDSVKPYAIPPGQVVATYATGPGAPPASEVAGRRQVLWIDVLGTDYNAAALDVEPGNASPAVAATWVWHKLNADHSGLAIIYTMIDEWPSVKAAVASLPSWMQARIRWWIADPTGSPHIVSGSQATQWYWGSSYDISTALPGF